MAAPKVLNMHMFDRLWLSEGKYLTPKLLFLDLSYWIKLVEGKEESFKHLSKLLEEFVYLGKVICPLSSTLMFEMEKQPVSPKRDAYYLLMEKLSKGLAIRHITSIFEDEFTLKTQNMSIDRSIAFSSIWFSFNDFELTIPDYGWNEISIREFGWKVYKHISQLPLTDVLNAYLTEDDRKAIFSDLNKGWEAIIDQEVMRNKSIALKRSQVEREEFVGTFKWLIPTILKIYKEIGIDKVLNLKHYSLGKANKNRKEILDNCPCFWLHYKLHAALRLAKLSTTITRNDFWDLNHIIPSIPYVDCLACDSPTRHLCTSTVKADMRFNNRIVSSAEEIIQWLEDLV